MYQTSRELFDAAREATQEVFRLNRELDAMDDAATSIGGGIVVASRHHVSDNDRMAAMVARNVERRETVEARIEENYRLIDAACYVLYGEDGIHDGLAAIAPAWWADAIYHHYLALRSWDVVSDLLGFGKRYLLTNVRAAFELMDANGMLATIAGRGLAD